MCEEYALDWTQSKVGLYLVNRLQVFPAFESGGATATQPRLRRTARENTRLGNVGCCYEWAIDWLSLWPSRLYSIVQNKHTYTDRYRHINTEVNVQIRLATPDAHADRQTPYHAVTIIDMRWALIWYWIWERCRCADKIGPNRIRDVFRRFGTEIERKLART